MQLELLRSEPAFLRFAEALLPCLLANLGVLREQRLHEIHVSSRDMSNEPEHGVEQVSKDADLFPGLIIRKRLLFLSCEEVSCNNDSVEIHYA